MRTFLKIAFFLTFSVEAIGANYNMTNGVQAIACPGPHNFYDSGGSAGTYAANESYTLTFTAGGGNCLQVTFSSFNTESGFDYLYVYDGPSTASPLIGTYNGTALPPTITSSSGSLTFRFTSDGSIQNAGWAAQINCVAPCSGAPTGGTANSAPASACAAGATVALSVTGASTGCGLTYQWQWAPVAAGPWTNIAGATATTHTPSVPSARCYRRITLCGASSGTSAPVCVTIGSCSTQLGTGVVSVASLPYSTSGTTCGQANDLTTANVSSSGCTSSSYFTGEDQVFIFTPTTSGYVNINLTSSGSYTGLMLYNTCPLLCAGSTGCVASAASSTGNKSLVGCVAAGTTYYLILDSWAAPACNPYSSLTISAPSPSATSNDFCGTPTPLTAGGTFAGNTNTMTADQPGNLSSVFCGSIENNQWFSFVASAATATFGFTGIGGASCPYGVQGQVFNASMTSTPCAACTNFTSMSSPCYNPGTLANGTLTATGLTPGQTYYLMVDGNAGSQCTFNINGWSIPVLPVDLIYFKGIGISSSSNKLEWMVAQESKLYGYVVQRSTDGKNFSDLDVVRATSSTRSEKTYGYYDKTFKESINYYRLKMVDNDGTFKYSSLVAINSNPNRTFTVNKIFPNPASSEIYMSVDVPTDATVEYEVLDITGRVVLKNTQAMSMGTGLMSVNLENLNKGIYYLKFNCENETKIEKFSLQ